MLTNSDIFNEFNQASSKALRLVVKIDWSTPVYITSHAGIPNIPAGAINDVLKRVSSVSQQLSPDEGRSTIGSLSFEAVDLAGAITTEIRSRHAAGEGINGVAVTLYRGGRDMDWSNFREEQTQQIDGSVTLSAGAYKFQCRDIQRAMRADIFDVSITKLAAQLDAGETTTLEVFDTSGFSACSHVASFGDETSGSFYYVKIKYNNGFEIVKATGKTATTFTGLTRGMFGTDDVEHVLPSGSDNDAGVEIEEYVYVELPAPAMAYALLTGDIIGGGTIPWSLGISTTLVDLPSFEDTGADWFDSGDYSQGLIFRFQGLSKTDGKRFIEREVCLLAGAFLRIGADGKIYFRRMTGVIASADYVAEINPDNAITMSDVKHNLARVRNSFDIEWSWVQFPTESSAKFYRRNILVDATSIAIHGESKPFPLQFKGLHNERHTYTTLINRFDALRDRYAGPPIEFSADLMPAMNDVEVGDIVRANFPHVRDYSAAGALDRSCEIQRISIDQETGRVTAQLFGSTAKAEPIVDAGAGAGAELPDGWYSSAGTEMGTLLSISGGVLQSSGSLTGGTTTRTVFYFLGDFTIASGLTLTISGNVELRIRGQLQINGTLLADGGLAQNTAGFVGTTFGGRGVLFGRVAPETFAAARINGQHSALPVLEIENNAGVLEGIPPDMRGSGGGRGGPVMHWESTIYVQEAGGGLGGSGGGSAVTVSRGVGYGVSGETDMSGADGAVGSTFSGHDSGSGGGGAPGCLVHLLDGSAVTFPILSGNVVAAYGTSPITAGNADTQGKALASDPFDLALAVARVAYVPKSRDPYPDYELDTPGGTGNSLLVANVYLRKATAPTEPATDDGSYNFTTNTLTPPSIAGGSADDWSATIPAADGKPLYVSQGLFEGIGGVGTDNTVDWTAPALLVSDGNSSIVANVYLRKATVPTEPVTDDGSYNFTTGTLTPPSVGGGSADNWSATPPASDGNPLYVSQGLFEIAGTVGTDSTVDWTAPAVLVSDGTDGDPGDPGIPGAPGNSSLVANVYLRKATAPTEPVTDDGSYNFTTKTLTPPSIAGGSADNWSATPPAADGNPAYVSTGIFEIAGTTGTDSTVDWTAPALLVSDGAAGDPGAAGNSSIVANVYLRKATAPTKPIDDDGSYNFTTKTLTPPSIAGGSADNWFTSPPTTDGNPAYVCTGIFEIAGTTGTDSTVDWTTPAVLVEDGAPGDPGMPGANTICFFDDADTSIAATSAGKYGFGTSTTVGTLDWATIVDGSSIIYLVVPNLSPDSAIDYSAFYPLIMANDVVTWYDDEAFPGRWVSFRTTGVGVSISGGYRFPVAFINHFDNGDTDDVPGTDNAVEFRWSRADTSATPPPRIQGIGASAVNNAVDPANAEAAIQINSDGKVYKRTGVGSSFGAAIGTYRLSGVAADYEFMFQGTGDTPTGSNVNEWLSTSTTRTFTLAEGVLSNNKQFIGQIKYRDATTLELLGEGSGNVYAGVIA